MKINGIVHRYVFKEMIPPFVINLAFLTFVFLMTMILDITDLIVRYSVDLSSILLLLIYAMPFFLEFIIPMSVMMAVLLSFLRLSSDNEIMAFKAGGISIYGLLPPVFVFCLIGFLLTGLVTIYGLPQGRLAFKALAYRVAVSNVEAGLKEKTFNDRFENIVLYVHKIDTKTRTFHDIFIEDTRRQDIHTTVVSPRGTLIKSPAESAYHLRLFDGTIHQVDPIGKTTQSLAFDTYDINLKLPHAAAPAKDAVKDEEEMSVSELTAYLRDHEDKKDQQYYLALMEFHKKLSLPSACFALGLLAVPLGVQSRSSKRSFGIGLGIIFFLMYYLLLSAGWVFGEAGKYPPLIGMWLPNIVIGAIGLLLVVRTANERYVGLDMLRRIADRWVVGRKTSSRV
ncbi:MAG: LPS export ABC transporter permease LptF [Desulfobacterales bacterium]